MDFTEQYRIEGKKEQFLQTIHMI